MSSPIKNDLPAVQSKFLLACMDVLSALGCQIITPFARPNCESIHVDWFPDMPRGSACFDVERNEWQFSNRHPDGENFGVDITETGEVSIREGDGDGTFLTLRIEEPDELGELFAFFSSISEEQVYAPAKWIATSLASIVEEIFLVIPKEGRDLLLPFNPQQFQLEQPKLWQLMDMLSQGSLPQVPFTNWAQWVADHADWNKMPALQPPGARDLFASPCGLQSWRMHLLRETEFFDAEPQLVLRISPKQSRMFFHTYLCRSREGSQVLQGLKLPTLNPNTLLKQTKVLYPTSLVVQRRLAVEFRALFREYQHTYGKLCETREPIRDLSILTKRRTQHIGKLHSEYLGEIDALSMPLPFFLEYPFRRYSRADEDLARISRGQQLFSMILRCLVLLPLEEALDLGLWPDTVNAICDELWKKPLPDGSWLEKCRQLRSIAGSNPGQLPLFGLLLIAIDADVESALKRILTARNEFHHPPNDAHAFIAVMSDNFPMVMEALRPALSQVRFIVPVCLKFEQGARLVRAHVLEGFEPDFRVCDLSVKASLESFPTGQLMAMSNGGEHPLVFSHYFRSQPVKTSTLDVGVFDKAIGDDPHFEFVRGYGNQPEWDQSK